MSFTGEVKEEVSKISNTSYEDVSELSGIISVFSGFKIVTENGSVARKAYSLIKSVLGVYPSVSVKKGYNYNKGLLYSIVLSNNDNCFKILGINSDKIDDFIVADEDLIRVFLRGIFMVSGSVNDPKKSRYHLEFNLKSKCFAAFVSKLLNDFNLNSKILHRDNVYMVYIKEAEKISDFLRIIGAMRAVLYFEDIRIYRDHKNMTNRLNNCEQANVDKMIETASNHIKMIDFIKSVDAYDLLNDKEKEVCEYRVKYPDVSLVELSEIISLETGNKITKSGLYHRFDKIKKFANKLSDKEG